MVVVVLERTPDRLRGALRRWMLELQAGVFVGRLAKRVRDELWERILDDSSMGAAVMIESSRSEQGYSVRVHGQPDRRIVDVEGLYLVARRKQKRAPTKPKRAADGPG